MPNKLNGKTIILTGSKVVASVTTMIEQHGGIVKHFPLIETVEAARHVEDEQFLHTLNTYDWLIFTSQNGVHFFFEKCTRAGIDLTNCRLKVAAVGEKTKQALEHLNIKVSFMPSIYSADVFVQEFTLGIQERALFVKGALAKSTLKDALPIDEWTVYETRPYTKDLTRLATCLHENETSILIFASPSAVRVFFEEMALSDVSNKAIIASIGHVTTTELMKYGITPHIQPEIYTMQAVIEQLILEEQSK